MCNFVTDKFNYPIFHVSMDRSERKITKFTWCDVDVVVHMNENNWWIIQNVYFMHGTRSGGVFKVCHGLHELFIAQDGTVNFIETEFLGNWKGYFFKWNAILVLAVKKVAKMEHFDR